ncbi:hypothetical protein Bbelb_054080 [Branchiostoma belcheri]|nr:hypothetical protein Bbelb_054080 [Branchiostoma belcheri]
MPGRQKSQAQTGNTGLTPTQQTQTNWWRSVANAAASNPNPMYNSRADGERSVNDNDDPVNNSCDNDDPDNHVYDYEPSDRQPKHKDDTGKGNMRAFAKICKTTFCRSFFYRVLQVLSIVVAVAALFGAGMTFVMFITSTSKNTAEIHKYAKSSSTEPILNKSINPKSTGPDWTVLAGVPIVLSDVPTEMSDVPTEMPDVPTEMPDVPTEMSDVPTEMSDVPTEMPDVPTEMPDVPTEMSDVPTEMPDVPTEMPDVPTEMSDVPTEMPDVPTELPDVPTLLSDAPSVFPDERSVLSELPIVLSSMILKRSNGLPAGLEPMASSPYSMSDGPAFGKRGQASAIVYELVGKHAGQPRRGKNSLVGEVVLPNNTKDPPEVSKVKEVESALLAGL